MTLLPSEILLAAHEIAASLGGRVVQKVVQPGPRAIALGFAAGWIYAAADRRHGRIHLLDEKPPGTGEAAPPFCMLLRKELVGARLLSVEPVLGERACALEFGRGRGQGQGQGQGTSGDPGADADRRRLLVFLYGGGARLALVDAAGRPLGALPPAPPGATLELPPPRDDDRPPRFRPPAVWRQIVEHFADRDATTAVDEARAAARSAARRDVERLARREQALVADTLRADDAAERRKHADLLLAHLADVPRGAAEVLLPDDFGDGSPLRVRLDPALSPQDNAARIYRDYRRFQRSRAVVAERLARTRAERAAAEAKLAAVERASDAELPALSPREGEHRHTRPSGLPGRVGRVGPADPGGGPRRPYRAFRSRTGALILVGKGADKNDELTFRVARGNDLWLHTRDVPGAHVVVPLAGRPVDEQTLLDAATLAVWFSPARPKDPLPDGPAAGGPGGPSGQTVQADVTYVLRKLVRKPRGAAPGRVSVAGGKTLRVRLERERVERLLASQGEP